MKTNATARTAGRMVSLFLASAALATACAPPPPPADGGADARPVTDAAQPEGGASDGGLGPGFTTPFDPGITAAGNTPNTINVTVSSEGLGQEGLDYAAMPAMDQIVFVDGWELRFESILTTLSNVRLNQPGTMPADPSMVGAAVAQDARSFAIDAKKMGSFAGAGGGSETAIPLFAFRQGAGGAALDPMVRYAFSFDIASATGDATNVNLSPEQFNDYREMIAKRWTLLLTGTATYRGRAAMAGTPAADYPTSVRFRYGFSAPTSYINCNNPDNGGEGSPGVAPRATGPARAQITLHMDHLFWLRLNVEDPPPHFDHFAARATPGAMGMPALSTLDDLMGVAPTNLVDRMMRPIPDRGDQTTGYTPMGPRLVAETNGASGLDDMRSFVAFSTRSFAHFNADGLCFVRPNGPITF
jgi:hypothetical protein